MKIYTILFAMLIMLASCNRNRATIEAIQGQWLLIETSGGFTGEGFDASWSSLTIEDDEFKLFTDLDDGTTFMILEGTIAAKTGSLGEDLYEFNIPLEHIKEVIPPIEHDPEKLIELKGDEMDWISPCCDRFNYHLKKQ